MNKEIVYFYLHPEDIKVVQRYGRWHHHVNYDKYQKNMMRFRDDFVMPKESNNYNLKLLKKRVNNLTLVFITKEPIKDLDGNLEMFPLNPLNNFESKVLLKCFDLHDRKFTFGDIIDDKTNPGHAVI